MLAIIDYGAGNLRSVVNAFQAVGHSPQVTNDPSELAKAAGIVLPGVGAFGDGMASLRRLGLVEVLAEQVLGQGKPYLGICLGMQFLAQESYEHGVHQGLGWLPGTVQRIIPASPRFRIPHIGWNDVQTVGACPLYQGLDPEPIFYFVHSYHLVVDEDYRQAVTATCCHGADITASVSLKNIYGVQFHPEKSQREGLLLLANFARLVYGGLTDAETAAHTRAHLARWSGSAKHSV
jgi:imidazole glycerol-phosphate synthase subunit HisH